MKCEIKYAPQTLADVLIPQAHIRHRIDAYAKGLLEGHIILWGTNGTGKSTVARLMPQAIGGEEVAVENKDYDELLNRKDLKDYLRQSCASNKLFDQSKFFLVFEEFDNAKVNLHKLWTAMDSCEDALMVIITTNNPMGIPRSVRDRCDLVEFGKLNANSVLPRAQFILQNEGLTLPDSDVLYYLKQLEWKGSLRGYMRKLDELLALKAMGLPMPPVPPNASSAANANNFSVVSGASIK